MGTTSPFNKGNAPTYKDLVSQGQFRPWHLSQMAEYEVQRTNNFALVLDITDGAGNDDWFTLSVDSCLHYPHTAFPAHHSRAYSGRSMDQIPQAPRNAGVS